MNHISIYFFEKIYFCDDTKAVNVIRSFGLLAKKKMFIKNIVNFIQKNKTLHMHRQLLDLKINFHKIILCNYFTNLDFLSIFFGSHDFPDLEIGTRLIQDFGFQTRSIVFMRARRTNLEIGLKCSCTFHLYFEKKLLTDR